MVTYARAGHQMTRTSRLPRYGIYPVRGRLLGEFLRELWVSACQALAVPAEQTARTVRELRDLLPSWANEPIGDRPRRPSYVAEDGFPAEMSVNWSGTSPELRVLFDCMSRVGDGIRPDLPGVGGASRFGRISEIFATAPLWHSMAWRPPDQVIHKSYFGLYTWPIADRYAAVADAMARLGMARAWADARRRAEGASGRREIEFFALDLVDTVRARVKIYYRNHDADTAELNRMASIARTHDMHGASAAYRALAGPCLDAGEAALTCLAFRPGLDRADEATTYLRMPSLAPTDADAVERAAALLAAEGRDPGPLHALASALAPGPLTHSTGLLELVSHRAARRRADITTYFRFSVYDRPAPVPHPEPVQSPRKESAVNNPDLERVAEYNNRRQREYESSDLIQLLADETTPVETRRAVLTYLQPWSNAFQRMISARVTYESDPALRLLALEHQKEEIGHDMILARSRAGDQRLVWDPVIEAGASWFVDQFATLPSVARAVLAHLALEAGSLALSKAGVRAFPDDDYFSLHDEADAEHLEMGYQVLRERDDWSADDLITVLDRAWQVITVVSDRIAECAVRETGMVAA